MSSTRTARAAPMAGAVLALALVAGCSDTSDPPQPSPSTVAGLSAPVSGRITRLIGDSTSDPVAGSTRAPASVSAPSLVLPTGPSLLGFQGAGPAVYSLAPTGAITVPSTGTLNEARVVAGVAVDGKVLIAQQAFDGLSLNVLDPSSGALATARSVSGAGPAAAAGLATVANRVLLQWGSSWFELAAQGEQPPTAREITAPVQSARVSAPGSGGRVLVLTDTSLVTLGRDLEPISRVSWTLPAEISDHVPTAATGDGAGGLYLTTSVAPGARAGRGSLPGGGGAVLHVTRDGTTTLLARGAPPDEDAGCADASRPAMQAHLSRPTSIAVWNGRLVVADSACHSVLQLPLP